MDAPVPEVPVEQAVDGELPHEGREVAQVGAQAGGGHGRVLEARPCLLVALPGGGVQRGAPAQSGAVRSDAPQGGRLVAGRVDDDGVGVGGPGERVCAGQGVLGGLVGAAHLAQQPPVAVGQCGDRAGALVAAHGVHEAPVHALDRQWRVPEDGGHVVGRLDHSGVAQGHEDGRGGQGDQADRDGQQRDQRPLGAREHRRKVAAPLGGEVLQGVAGHLASEGPQFAADGSQVGADQGGQPRDLGDRGCVAGRGGEAAPPPVHALH